MRQSSGAAREAADMDGTPRWGSIEGGAESVSPSFSSSSSSAKGGSGAGGEGGLDLDALDAERAALVGRLEAARKKMHRAEDDMKVVGELEDVVATAEGLRRDNERLRAQREARVPTETYQEEVCADGGGSALDHARARARVRGHSRGRARARGHSRGRGMIAVAVVAAAYAEGGRGRDSGGQFHLRILLMRSKPLPTGCVRSICCTWAICSVLIHDLLLGSMMASWQKASRHVLQRRLARPFTTNCPHNLLKLHHQLPTQSSKALLPTAHTIR